MCIRVSNLLKNMGQGFELICDLIFNGNPSPVLFSRQSLPKFLLLCKTKNCQVTNLITSSIVITGREASLVHISILNHIWILTQLGAELFLLSSTCSKYIRFQSILLNFCYLDQIKDNRGRRPIIQVMLSQILLIKFYSTPIHFIDLYYPRVIYSNSQFLQVRKFVLPMYVLSTFYSEYSEYWWSC